MASKQRLKLTLSNVVSKRTWDNQPLEVEADPEDHSELRPYAEQMARDLDHRGESVPWWADQYKLRVQGVTAHWIDFWISGGGH